MRPYQPSLFTRHDTFFGVCEGIGQDFGFNPNYLRLVLAVAVLASPLTTLAVYLGAGVVIAASRWMFPVRVASPPAAEAPDASVAPLNGDNDEDAVDISAAA